MRILIYSAYYEPEVASSLYLSTNLYEDFAKNGWEVELFVPMPTRGVDDKTRKAYKKKREEIKGNLRIHRILLMREKSNVLMRAARYLLMNMIFIWKGITTKADVIFVQSTPPTQGAMAAIIKKIKKIPFIYNLQDIFPDSMIGMGMTKEGSLICRVGRMVERFTYKNADKIIAISNDMKNNLIGKGVPEDKIAVISNWIDLDTVKPIPKESNYLFEKFRLSRENFYVVYAGNLGHAQNIEVIIRAAKKLENYEKIKFVVFGKGAQEEKYKRLAEEMGVINLAFFPIQPYSEVSYVYSLADVSIVSCKKGFGGSAMPSKTWSILATGTPILASFDEDTDLQKLISKNCIGFFSRPEDEEKLCSNILELFHNPNVVEKMGKEARSYIEKNVSRSKATNDYMKKIMEIYNESANKY